MRRIEGMISIIICTYNRQKFILKTLQCLREQDFPASDFEIIIINNNSSDNTKAICTDFMNQSPGLQINYVEEYNQGLSYARNRGIKEAKGTIITFIDDDAFAVPGFLKSIHGFFSQNSSVLALGGKVKPEFETGKPSWMSPFLMPLVAALDMGQGIKEFTGKSFPVGANMSFRAEVFERFGLFNNDLGRKGNSLLGSEEKDFFNRLKKASVKIVYLPEAEVTHVIPPIRVTMEYIKRQAIGIGVSERLRVKGAGFFEELKKMAEELFKVGATVLISLYYSLTFQFPKAFMLIKFRFWVLKGFYSSQSVS